MKTHRKQLYMMLLRWIHYVWLNNVDIEPSKRWVDTVEGWVNRNGTLWTIAHIKMVKNIYTRFLCGRPVHKVDQLIGIDKDGFPKALKEFKKLSNSHVGRRYILTLLSISRTLPGTKEPDYSTITKPSTAEEETLKELIAHIPVFMGRYGIKPFGKPRWTQDDYHYSVKSGPVGPSTLTAQLDAHRIEPLIPALGKMSIFAEILIRKLQETIPKRSAEEYTGRVLGRLLPVIKPGYVDVFRHKKRVLPERIRRLSIVDDPEAKARIVAIFDYFSQSILRKLHLELFELLRGMKQDRTFTQDPFIPRRIGHQYHSLDLSAATDRFPLKLQKPVIAWLTGSEEYADGWEEVLVKTPFETPKGEQLTYAAGQPMGAYSSWGAFAVTHHLVVDYCALQEGLEPQSEFYILLGDDIVINHDGVADRYREIMSRLGVSISPLKTHVSYSTYEFAKRWFHYGKEVTGIQLAGYMNLLEIAYQKRASLWVASKMKECKGKSRKARTQVFKSLWKKLPSHLVSGLPLQYHLVTASLCELRDRGIPYRLGLNILDQVSLLYKCLGHKPRVRENLARKAANFNAMMKFIRSHDPDDVINVVRQYNAIGNNKFMGDFQYPHRYEDKWDLVLRHLYLAMDSSVQSRLNGWYDYARILAHDQRAIEGLLDQSDVWKSPIWMFYQLPIIIAIEGVLKGASNLIAGADVDEDLKEVISFTSLPDPSRATSARASTRILGSHADLTNKFMSALYETAQVRPTLLQNYGNRALLILHIRAELGVIRNRRPYYGLLPE